MERAYGTRFWSILFDAMCLTVVRNTPCGYAMSFDACVGDGFSFIGVEEVRLFNIQKIGKRPGRSRRMPKGKRKLRNMARPSIPSSKGVRKPTRQTRKRIVKEIED